MSLLLPKIEPLRDQRWLDHLKTQRCILTGQRGTDYDAVDPASSRRSRKSSAGRS